MNTIGYYIGISKQSEVLFLILAGICCTIFDASLFNLQTNLYKVWNAPMDATKFTDTAQLYVKYILSSIVLVRTFTVHLYLAFYIVMLWPAIFGEKCGLLIPWLIVGAVKCLAMGAMSLSTGLYICLAYRFSKAACWDFLIAQVIDQGPAIYMWFCVLSYYYHLKRKTPHTIYRPVRRSSSTMFSLAERRRRVRSLFADAKLQNTFEDDRQLISVSTIDNIINHLNMNLHRETTRSLDSLLTRMAAEAEKEEILSNKDEVIEEDKDLSYADKTLKVLNISPSYVDNAKSRKVFCTSINPPKDKALKVQSSPLLFKKKSIPDFSISKIVKAPPSNNDELSLILSETEMNTVGFTDNQKQTEGLLEEVHLEIHLKSNELSLNIQDSANQQNVKDIKDESVLEELHHETFKKSDSEPNKIYVLDIDTNDTKVSALKKTIERNNVIKEVPKTNIQSPALKQKFSKIPSKVIKVNTSNSKKSTAENNLGDKNLTPETSKKVPKLPEVKLKSRSQGIYNQNTFTPTFKHDGYTLAYIESLRRQTATDVIRNRRRPNSSGI